jgi:DNA polymerase I-like protein with 3'-5' exonuclease and polymerase domains
MKLVGCDAKGLELRMLAHYLYSLDGGAYAKIVVEGDPHISNQKAAGLDTRDVAKTFIYAFNYGAGNRLLGSKIDPEADKQKQEWLGAKARERFLRRIPGLKHLIDRVKTTSRQRSYLIGLDGRRLHIRSEHLALNTLLQGAGACVMKMATVIMHEHFRKAKMEVYQALNIHDENQVYCKPEIAEDVGGIMADSITLAGEELGVKCPLEGEYKIGESWMETH